MIFKLSDYPNDKYGWVEAHFPIFGMPRKAGSGICRPSSDDPERFLPRNTAECSSQWLYHKYAGISGGKGRYVIDTTRMPRQAYEYELLAVWC